MTIILQLRRKMFIISLSSTNKKKTAEDNDENVKKHLRHRKNGQSSGETRAIYS